jgi:formylglycine-generating enzyme required for sulfatase activity
VFDASEMPRTAAFEDSPGGGFRLRLDAPGPLTITMALTPAAAVPGGMVFVPGGRYQLVASGKPVTTDVHLDDFFIDQFEVTNRAFREFVVAGGYARPEFWPPSTRPADFRDRTGQPGPRSWTHQAYPNGFDEHPVTDITWYEAAAYAAFRGAQLPTVFQWEKAARDGRFSRVLGYVMPWGLVDPADGHKDRANFQSDGTVPVASFPFGISPYGVSQMAGNVAEWCANPRPAGFTVAGGSWQDPSYLFGTYGSYPGQYASGTIGFRTVKAVGARTSDQGAMPLATLAAAPIRKPVNDLTYRSLLGHYQYDKTPLDGKVIAVRDGVDWTREQITFVGANGERAAAYLYRPKGFGEPLPVIHYVPSDAVLYGLTVPDEVEALMTPLIRSGRAVFAVVNQGFSERRFDAPYTPPERSSVRYRDLLVHRAVDLQRGLDYLATRREIDMSRLAAFGTSIWSSELIPFAIEKRYRAIVLLSAGIPATEGEALPEANAVNFVPRVSPPTLVLLGRHDESMSYEAESEPLFALFTPPKSLRLFDGGHVPPLSAWVPVAISWLDAHVESVRRPKP